MRAGTYSSWREHFVRPVHGLPIAIEGLDNLQSVLRRGGLCYVKSSKGCTRSAEQHAEMPVQVQMQALI